MNRSKSKQTSRRSTSGRLTVGKTKIEKLKIEKLRLAKLKLEKVTVAEPEKLRTWTIARRRERGRDGALRPQTGIGTRKLPRRWDGMQTSTIVPGLALASRRLPPSSLTRCFIPPIP